MVNILIVDDEENILWLLNEGLSDKNTNIFTASNRLEASKFLDEKKIDICLVDIFLENDNGLDF
ncbi:MAG: response regulator, partial [Deferribacterales bacterium]